MNTRNFRVKGDISCLFSPGGTIAIEHIAGIEVQLWHKAPIEVTLLGKSLTDSSGEFVIDFEIDSPVPYIVDGKISDVFIDAYLNGTKLDIRNPTNLLTGLNAYWKLDEVSGATATDATGNSHTGTLSGTSMPNWASGKINNGLNMNGGLGGTNVSYLNVPSSTDFDFGTNDFTYAFWMKPNNTSGYYTIIDTGYPTTGALLLQFTVPNSVGINISGTTVYTRTLDITVGTWYYVILRRIAGNLELIVNGSSLGAVAFTGSVSCPASSMTIGAYSGGGQNLDGVLDEIGIWKGHGLTDEEISMLYNSGSGLQYPF